VSVPKENACADLPRNLRSLAVNNWLKTALCVGTILSTAFISGACFAQTYANAPQNRPSAQTGSQKWENSPQNWRNSPDNWQNNARNWQNSSQDWQNSPQNWQNSSQNYNNANSIYDSNGNRLGYAVPRDDKGGVNYFNNNGNRTGYQLYDENH
jgi:hypothetical protein